MLIVYHTQNGIGDCRFLFELTQSLVADIYVGDDGKLHKVQGGADSVLPFSGEYKEMFVGSDAPLMFVVKNDKSMDYNNGIGTLTGNYITCVYSSYNATFTALQDCTIGYKIGNDAYTEKTFTVGQQIAYLPYNNGFKACLLVK